MTDQLKDLLTTRAASADPPPLDLTTITTAGTRRIRRRRFSAIAGTAVVTAGAIVTGLGIGTLDHSESDPAEPPRPFAEQRVTYAMKDVLHYGNDKFSIGAGERFGQFVRTDVGFVYTSIPKGDGGLDGKPAPDGSDQKRGRVTLLDRDGHHVLARGTGWFGLVADRRGGSVVGWDEMDAKVRGKLGPIVLYDLAARRELLRIERGGAIPGVADRHPSLVNLVAIEGNLVYFATERGAYELDLSTKRGRLREPAHAKVVGPLNDVRVLDVVNGQYLYMAHLTAQLAKLYVGAALDPAKDRELTAPGVKINSTSGVLAPSGKYAVLTRDSDSTYGRDIAVVSTETGRPITLEPARYRQWRFGQWLDSEKFVAAGIKNEKARVDLLECSARTGQCRLLTAGFAKSFVLDRTMNPDRVVFPSPRMDNP